MTTDLCTSIRSSPRPAKTEATGIPPAKLRIGMVTHYMPPHIGGIELIAEALFGVYAASGCEVRWVASRAPASAAPREPGRTRVRCWNGFEQRLAVPWPIWGPAGLREVARLVRWADVLDVHDCLYLGSAITVLAARYAHKPVLLSQHIGHVQFSSAVFNGIESLAYHTLGRATLRGASHLVFCTPAAEEFVARLLGGRPGTTSIIPYGIDTVRFRPPTDAERLCARRKLGLPEAGRIVLFVGRLVEKKGAGFFLEVCRRMPSFQFLMVGDGPLRPGPMKNLTWLPFVPPERMDAVYQAADALLLPSHGEGFPLAVLEAMATEVPVIVSKGEPFTGLLEREQACLSAEQTAAALCEAVAQLWRTPGLHSALGTRSRELVARDWSLKSMGPRYLALLHDLAMRS